MARKTVNFTEKDLQTLEKLKEFYDSISLNDTVRRIIAQASVLSSYANDGELIVTLKDGRTVHLPVGAPVEKSDENC